MGSTQLSEPDYQAATTVVRDLFGGSCLDPPPLGITLDMSSCGVCAACSRDWTPEARAIVDAALATPENIEEQP